MQENTTRWSSLSAFPGQHKMYSFLQKCSTILHPGELSGYYFNLGLQRGPHITLFVENAAGDNRFPPSLLRRIDGFLAASRQEATRRIPSGAHQLFMDIPDGEMLRNWRRLRAEPFLYFSENARKLYYEILQLTAGLVMGQSEASFEAIMRNKVSFCYNVILLILACIDNSDPALWAGGIDDTLKKELFGAGIKLDRDPEPALQRAFDKNKDALMSVYTQIFRHKDVEGYGAFKKFKEGLLRLNMPSLDKPVSQYLAPLINDIYDTVGLDQGLTCSYFLKNALTAGIRDRQK